MANKCLIMLLAVTAFVSGCTKGNRNDPPTLPSRPHFNEKLLTTIPDALDSVSEPVFSPDGAHVAYCARKGGTWRVVLDGAAREEYKEEPKGLVFSADSRRLAYVASTEPEKFCVVVQEVDALARTVKKGAGFDRVEVLRFDPYGRVTYWAHRGDRETVVIADIAGKGFRSVGWPSIAADGKWCAYDGRDDDDRAVVVLRDLAAGRTTHKLAEGFRTTWSAVLSADAGRVAYVGAKGKQSRVVVQELEDGSPRIACGVRSKPRMGRNYDSVTSLDISPDGRRIAYKAAWGVTQWIVGTTQLVIVENVDNLGESPTICESCIYVDELALSPDGRWIAYVVNKGGSWYEGPWLGSVIQGRPEGGSDYVMIDEVQDVPGGAGLAMRRVRKSWGFLAAFGLLMFA